MNRFILSSTMFICYSAYCMVAEKQCSPYASPLHRAVLEENIEAIENLFKIHANLEMCDEEGNSPLHYAVKEGKTESLKLLLALGANIEAKNLAGCTPIICTNSRVIINLLKQSGAKLQIAMNGENDIQTLINQDSSKNDTAFPEMIIKGNAAAVKHFLDSKKYIPLIDPLNLAIIWAQTGIVKLLLDHGANPNTIGVKGTPLHLASAAGAACMRWMGTDDEVLNERRPLEETLELEQLRITEELLRKGANIHATDDKNMTPLELAVMLRKFECVKLLTQKNARIRPCVWRRHLWLLYKSIHDLDPEHVKVLIAAGVPLADAYNFKRESGETLLSEENIMLNKTRTVAHAQASEAPYQDYDTRFPLHKAVAFGQTEIARSLLANCADIEKKDHRGRTPLLLAALFNHVDLAELLLENGANIEFQILAGLTPLALATVAKQHEVAKLLLLKKANTEAKNLNMQTLLHIAAISSSPELIKLLIEHGAHIEAKDILGETPLHKAVANGKVDYAKMLLAMGADKEALNRLGENAIAIARANNHYTIIQLLEKKN